jgi:hypothetical protein
VLKDANITNDLIMSESCMLVLSAAQQAKFVLAQTQIELQNTRDRIERQKQEEIKSKDRDRKLLLAIEGQKHGKETPLRDSLEK